MRSNPARLFGIKLRGAVREGIERIANGLLADPKCSLACVARQRFRGARMVSSPSCCGSCTA